MRALWIRLRTAVLAMLCASAVLTSATASAQSLNYEGLWWNAPGGSESGWGLNVMHQGDVVFASWFTYDATGDGWWLSMTAQKVADKTYSGTLIETSGPAFNAVPFDPAKVTRTAVGTGTLTFNDANNGVFTYTAKGVTQTKVIVRYAFSTVPTCIHASRPDFEAATNYQDLWWVANGAESGWGVNIIHQGEILFASWYTYDADGSPMWLSVTAAKVAPGAYTGDLIRTRGPAFNAVPFDPALVTRTVVGTATFTFANGNAATFAYTVGGASQVKMLTRTLFAPPSGTVCTLETFGRLTFDKISLATFPGAQEVVSVTALDAGGGAVDWTVQSANEAVARAQKIGTKINVTGMGLGRTQLTVRSSVGEERTLPVRIYDPMVIGVGVRPEGAEDVPEEIQIKYVDRFACRWSDAHAGARWHASFYHPVGLDGGWRALGSLGVNNALECPSVDGKQWMMVVRANPEGAVPGNLPPLQPPLRFEKEWDDAGTGGDVMFGAFWTPICPNGYRAMGTVVTGGWTSAGRNAPSINDVTCVRADLTVPARAGAFVWNDEGTGSDVRYQGSFTLATQKNLDYESSTVYLAAGTFVTQGELRSCTDGACWTAPSPGARTVMNVLAVDLPMLVDTPRAATLPQLTSFDQPPLETEPLMGKAMLVPFTAIGSANYWATKGTGWMVNNSPFVRAERVLRWKLEFWQYNTSSVEQRPSKTFTKGIGTTDSTSFSHTVGISVTASGGVEFLGTGGEISATVSYDFGYATQHSVDEFSEEETTVTIYVPARKAAAAWRANSEIAVKLHNLATHQFEPVTSVRIADSLFYVTDDYPD